jgi:hypothetical protein
MAKFFGGKSKYLVWMDRTYSFAALVLELYLLFILCFVFLKNFNDFFNSPKLFLLLLIFLPFFYIFIGLRKEYLNISNRFYRGSKAEGFIYYKLRKLPRNYSVFQCVRMVESKKDVDFVVLGPNGIFTAEVKSHVGKITYDGQNLLRNGRLFEKNLLGQSMNQALYIKNYLQNKFYITSILVFSNKHAYFNLDINPIKNIHILNQYRLINFILDNKDYIDEKEKNEIETVLSELCPSK